jgi:hypothetical protein
MDKILATYYLLCLWVTGTAAFMVTQHENLCHPRTTTSTLFGYIPDGMSPEQWRKLKEKEKQTTNKDLGAYGPSTFQSRSLRAFQQVREERMTFVNRGTKENDMHRAPQNVSYCFFYVPWIGLGNRKGESLAAWMMMSEYG